jgi:hypothetical protein
VLLLFLSPAPFPPPSPLYFFPILFSDIVFYSYISSLPLPLSSSPRCRPFCPFSGARLPHRNCTISIQEVLFHH